MQLTIMASTCRPMFEQEWDADMVVVVMMAPSTIDWLEPGEEGVEEEHKTRRCTYLDTQQVWPGHSHLQASRSTHE